MTKQQYLNILNSKIEYLNNLKTLDTNWINDCKAIPNETVIENSIYFMTEFSKYIQQETEENIIFSNIIIGPTPEGDVCIEFHLNTKNNIYFIFKNNGTVEIDSI